MKQPAGIVVYPSGYECWPDEWKCGFRPPMALQNDGCGVGHTTTWKLEDDYSYHHLPCYMCESPQRAVVLRWKGKDHTAGMDFLFRLFKPDYRTGAPDMGALRLGLWIYREKEYEVVFLDDGGIPVKDMPR